MNSLYPHYEPNDYFTLLVCPKCRVGCWTSKISAYDLSLFHHLPTELNLMCLLQGRFLCSPSREREPFTRHLLDKRVIPPNRSESAMLGIEGAFRFRSSFEKLSGSSFSFSSDNHAKAAGCLQNLLIPHTNTAKRVLNREGYMIVAVVEKEQQQSTSLVRPWRSHEVHGFDFS